VTVTADPEASTPTPAKPRRRRPGTGTIALATALLALASGGVGLYWDLNPDARPDPRTELGAQLSVFSVEPHVTYDDWLHRTSGDATVYRKRRALRLREVLSHPQRASPQEAADALRATGILFYVHLTIEGFKRRSISMRWSMYDRATGERLADPSERDQRAARFVLGAPSDSSVALVWTPAVARRGAYFARFELVAAGGTVLAVSDSPKFRGLVG
jgi:hypothetical protein